MNYFVRKEDTIEKYLVQFDKNELTELRLEIINNCSEVTHYEYESTSGPNHLNYLKIRNYQRTKIGRVETNREFGEMSDLYHFSYDEYEYPYLVTIIDGLLNDNKEAVLKIMNPDYNLEKPSFEHRIRELSEEIDAMSNLETKKKIEKLNELQSLIEKAKINDFKKPILPYYQKVQDLLTIELVDSIDVEELTRIQNFFGIELKKAEHTDKHVQKVLTI